MADVARCDDRNADRVCEVDRAPLGRTGRALEWPRNVDEDMSGAEARARAAEERGCDRLVAVYECRQPGTVLLDLAPGGKGEAFATALVTFREQTAEIAVARSRFDQQQ